MDENQIQNEEQLQDEEATQQTDVNGLTSVKGFMKDIGYDGEDASDYDDAVSKMTAHIGTRSVINRMAANSEDDETLELLKTKNTETITPQDAVAICGHAFGIELSEEEAVKQVHHALNKLIDQYENMRNERIEAAKKAYEDERNGIVSAIKAMNVMEALGWDEEEEANLIYNATVLSKDGESDLMKRVMANKANAVAALALVDALSQKFENMDDFIAAIRNAKAKQAEEDFSDQILRLSFL